MGEKTGNNLTYYGGMEGVSFLAVCEGEMIKHLPHVCNGTFDDYLPTGASKNEAPSVPNVTWLQTDVYFNGSDWDRCNVHAFCFTCADPDGSLNKYCEAVMQRYNWWKT